MAQGHLSHPTATRPTAASVHMDMLRGIAALAVFLDHSRGLLFVDYREVVHPSLAVNVAYLLTSLDTKRLLCSST